MGQQGCDSGRLAGRVDDGTTLRMIMKEFKKSER